MRNKEKKSQKRFWNNWFVTKLMRFFLNKFYLLAGTENLILPISSIQSHSLTASLYITLGVIQAVKYDGARSANQ